MINKIREYTWFETVLFAGFFAFKYITCEKFRTCKYNKPNEIEQKNQAKSKKQLKDYRIAIISDELTYVNFSYECQLFKLTPNNWQDVFKKQEIDLFLCESAWEGCKIDQQCWRGRIYKNHKVYFETRKVLFDILNYCNCNSIPTVFWNKEDPTFFDSIKSDFSDTAMYFQYIFTTDSECLKHYQLRGHNKVFLMTFGFSPHIYNPMQKGLKKRQAIFAGSWIKHDKARCTASTRLFQKVLDAKIPLVIYDRNSESFRKAFQYPSKFKQYIHPALNQKELGTEIRKSQYAIDINTATQSKTMFARRVYELMASNVYIIANDSLGMEEQLIGRYCGPKDVIPHSTIKTCRENVNYVFAHHTNNMRLSNMLRCIGFQVEIENIYVAICSSCMQEKHYRDKEINADIVSSMNQIDSRYQYFMIWEFQEYPPLQEMIAHFSYLKEDCGIRVKKEFLYHIVEDNKNKNVVFPICFLESLQTDMNTRIKKYNI